MKKIPHETWIAWSAIIPPRLVILTPAKVKHRQDLESLACRKDDDAFQKAALEVYGKGITHAVPAWDAECLQGMAARYEGPFEAEVRGLCAAILLDRPLRNLDAPPEHEARAGLDGKSQPAAPARRASPPGRSDGSGGKRARISPPAPVAPGSGGATFTQ